MEASTELLGYLIHYMIEELELQDVVDIIKFFMISDKIGIEFEHLCNYNNAWNPNPFEYCSEHCIPKVYGVFYSYQDAYNKLQEVCGKDEIIHSHGDGSYGGYDICTITNKIDSMYIYQDMLSNSDIEPIIIYLVSRYVDKDVELIYYLEEENITKDTIICKIE